jgi:glucose-1-phosphate thymidylyltransferase
LSIREKPKKSDSNLAITCLYFFDNKAVNYSKTLKPSKRNELEIVDLLNKYRKKNKLNIEFLGRGGAWLDTGSMDDFYNTSIFVSALENRQGFKIACLEEIGNSCLLTAFVSGLILVPCPPANIIPFFIIVLNLVF